jgi:flagellar assembly protein FliH
LFDTLGRSNAPAAQFANVTPERRRPPSWVVAHSRGFVVGAPNPVALKPAHLPHDLDELNDPARLAVPPSPVPPPATTAGSAPFHAEEPVHPPEPAIFAAPEPVAPAGPDPEATAAFMHAAEQFQRATAELERARRSVLSQTEAQLVELATVIAHRVIARELSLKPDVVVSLVREGLEALGSRDRLQVRIGHGFAEALELLSSELGGTEESKVSVDSTLPDYGCVVDTQLGRVDESIEKRFDAIVLSLTREAAPLR